MIKDPSEVSKNSRNAKFLWFQLFIDVLTRTQHRTRDRDDLIDYCRGLGSLTENDLHYVDDFEETYQPSKAIWWYTLPSCLYGIMNKALRHQDFDTLYVFRCFITDVAKQVQEGYQTFMRTNTGRQPLQLYRGQAISVAELDALQRTIGGFLSMNSFLR